MSKQNRRATKKLLKQQRRTRELLRAEAWEALSEAEKEAERQKYREYLDRVVAPAVRDYKLAIEQLTAELYDDIIEFNRGNREAVR